MAYVGFALSQRRGISPTKVGDKDIPIYPIKMQVEEAKKYKVDEFFDCFSNAYMPFHLFCQEEIIKILHTHIYI